jgi:serine protease Do
VVEGVAGASARAGLMPGDVLLSINGIPLKTVDQVREIMGKKPKSVALLVLREGTRIFVPVELG